MMASSTTKDELEKMNQDDPGLEEKRRNILFLKAAQFKAIQQVVANPSSSQGAIDKLKESCFSSQIISSFGTPLVGSLFCSKAAFNMGLIEKSIDILFDQLFTTIFDLSPNFLESNSQPIRATLSYIINTILPASNDLKLVQKTIDKLRPTLLAPDTSDTYLGQVLKTFDKNELSTFIVQLEFNSSEFASTKKQIEELKKTNLINTTQCKKDKPEKNNCENFVLKEPESSKDINSKMKNAAKMRPGESYKERLERMRAMNKRRMSKESQSLNMYNSNDTNDETHRTNEIDNNISEVGRHLDNDIESQDSYSLTNRVSDTYTRIVLYLKNYLNGKTIQSSIYWMLLICFFIWRRRRANIRKLQKIHIAQSVAKYLKDKGQSKNGPISIPAHIIKSNSLIKDDLIDGLYNMLIGSFIQSIKMSFNTQAM